MCEGFWRVWVCVCFGVCVKDSDVCVRQILTYVYVCDGSSSWIHSLVYDSVLGSKLKWSIWLNEREHLDILSLSLFTPCSIFPLSSLTLSPSHSHPHPSLSLSLSCQWTSVMLWDYRNAVKLSQIEEWKNDGLKKWEGHYGCLGDFWRIWFLGSCFHPNTKRPRSHTRFTAALIGWGWGAAGWMAGAKLLYI